MLDLASLKNPDLGKATLEVWHEVSKSKEQGVLDMRLSAEVLEDEDNSVTFVMGRESIYGFDLSRGNDYYMSCLGGFADRVLNHETSADGKYGWFTAQL